jgi:very-short-patch-repair endonuclease
MSHKKTLEDYIVDFIKIHGDKYTYPKQTIIGNKTKIKIICTEHGEFEQTISAHKMGQGCPECAKKSRKQKRKLTTKDFIQDAIKIHGNKYDYSLVQYTDNNSKVKIICPEHGVFEQTRNNHIIQKQKCPKCAIIERGNSKSITDFEFIEKCNNIHDNYYDYSLVNYINTKTKVKVICPTHGIFETIPYNHMNGSGCKKCKTEYNATKLSNKSSYLYRVNKVHSNKYTYPNFSEEYKNVGSFISIICPEHGVFTQIAKDHLRGCGCPKCGNTFSQYEEFIKNYLIKNNIGFKERDRTIITPYELDFVIEDYKIAIEVNGVYWHGEQAGKDKYYHKNKTDRCNKNGYRLIHIFEDDFQKKKIITSKLDSIFRINKRKIYARKCDVRVIPSNIKSKFLNKYHLQGNCKSDTSLGLYYKNRLVSVMTFGKNRSQELELNRFCSIFNFYIIGGAGKLLKYFQRNYEYDYIVSYADLTMSEGGMYKQLGFSIDYSKRSINPDYKYYNRSKSSCIRHHKSKFSKSRLKSKLDNFDETKSEWKNMQENGWDRIWDCGKLRFILNS